MLDVAIWSEIYTLFEPLPFFVFVLIQYAHSECRQMHLGIFAPQSNSGNPETEMRPELQLFCD